MLQLDGSFLRVIGSFLLIAMSSASCDASAKVKAEETYTLYRSSMVATDTAIYIAAFDSTEGYDDLEYNKENCEQAALLFNEYPPGFANLGDYFCRRGKPQR